MHVKFWLQKRELDISHIRAFNGIANTATRPNPLLKAPTCIEMSRLKALDPRTSGGLLGVGRVLRIGDAGPPWGLLVPTHCLTYYTLLDGVSR